MKPLLINAPIVSVNWLAEHLDHPDVMILDGSIKKAVSDQDNEFSEYRIKNALFFDIKKSFSDLTSTLPNMLPTQEDFSKACKQLGISAHHKIVVYDILGMYSSARVWWMFKVMGHENVTVLDGGLPAWKNAGLPLEHISTPQQSLPKGNFVAQYKSGSAVDRNTVLNAINAEDILILDARANGRFYGTAPEPRSDLKSGHIPSSISLPYTRVLNNNKMLSVADLKRIFDDFDIENKKLIFSCGSGITACIILLAAELAGYDLLSIYDGSWTEWGQLEGVPIEC